MQFKVWFRVNNELAGLCHFWGEDPKNDISEETKMHVPSIVIVPVHRMKGLTKGDSILVDFDENWEVVD